MKIGELSKLGGVSAETVRYYERCGLLEAPVRSANGYRRYGREALDALCFIKTCRSLGFSMEEIRQLSELKKHPAGDCRSADELVQTHLAAVARKIAQLQAIQSALLELGGCRENRAADCKVMQSLQHSHGCADPSAH